MQERFSLPNRLPYKNITMAVRERLMMELLFSNKYEPGEWINESVIVNELNISKAPIREALRELAAIGLVQIVPHKGARVTEFTKRDMEEIYTIRYMLEECIFKDIIVRDAVTEDDINHLNGIAQKMKMIAMSDKPKELILGNFLEKDLEFHKYLWLKADLKWTIKMLLDIYLLLILGIYKFLLDANLTETAEYHFRIIDYIKAKDIEKFKKDRSESYYALRRCTSD
ncbi:transcriptional regulator, GntR family [Acetomicrobium hydrogeniformans ATCC BAA-1850]|uniref:Transcriptional regulator, GntR family n=2 Tax=Acetomicrobium hydrogeniformans TaxID=649746 RepID=A0A0T5X9S7_9BACT|nr:transcriptional regulator, GntR family [Acetomicrobium hydrogeniformans ATCC BAA-1850]